MNPKDTKKTPIKLPMIALRGLVLFPKMVLHFDVAREKSILALNHAMNGDRLIYLVAQKEMHDEDPSESELYDVGVVAEIRQILKVSGDGLRVLVEGSYRARTKHIVNEDKFYEALCEPYPLKSTRNMNKAMADALMRTVKELFEQYCFLSPKMPRELVLGAASTEDPVALVEFIAGNIPIHTEDKQRILSESSVTKRLRLLAEILENENTVLGLEKEIYDKVRDQVDKNQREYYLREQMKVISGELGDNESVQDEALYYMDMIDELDLPEESAKKLMKEAERLYKMPSNSHEANVIRTYLDITLELPWNRSTKDKIDIGRARKILDRDHYGLTKIKDRIIEILAVRKLAPDIKGQIICLVGPPGVGKTSVARSIAKSMGRKYARISLGGVRDESDIRGHRKTYIGAMPGRIINGIKLANSKNPLILLDEIDKLGSDFRGDPSSALLEVLDSEQNAAFRDHYIEIPFDLSDTLFIATANNLDTVPAPLLDRMEIISLTSYTREEKFQIAKRHLAAKQMKKHGLTAKTLRITDDAFYSLIDSYTREAGVRSLERMIATVCRKAASKIVAGEQAKITVNAKNLPDLIGPHKFKPDDLDKTLEPGLVNGLAWTSVGGEVLQVEVAVMEGTGKVELTGSLGKVMKESATAAVSYIRSNHKKLGVPANFYKERDIHIHFPEGAVPKDGPSAGITVCTALISALTDNPARADIAMTGEITLRGRVLAIGGLKEKTMAAYRAGLKTVIIPDANAPDIAELDDVVKNAIHFITADKMDKIIDVAFPTRPKAEQPEAEAASPELPVASPFEVGKKGHNKPIIMQ